MTNSTTNSRRACAWLGLATLGTALVASFAGCPPNLTGEPCNSDCACPTSQTCVVALPLTDGMNHATCQDGVNTCDGGGPAAFAGTVVLNGGAAASNGAAVYGYADGILDLDGGIYVDADLMQLSSTGDFAFSGSVPPATGNGYRFVAVYNTNSKDGGDFNVEHTGVSPQGSANMLAPGSDAGLSMRIDVQTSTCFSITVDFPQAGVSALFAAGIVAYDTHTGAPLVQPGDFHAAYAIFDAGSPIPFIDAGSPFGELTLLPAATVPLTGITSAWLYTPPGLTAISEQGAFLFSFNDSASAKPEYPGGTCAVAYAPPPGFPGNLTINGLDGGPAWGGGASSARGQDLVAWQDDAVALPAGVTFLGDLVSIDGNDAAGTQLYPAAGAPPQFVVSPLTLKDSTVPLLSCSQLAKKSCTLNVTSLYQDARKPRSVPYEGGTTVLTFQRAPSSGG